jgi:hypothetical protein
MDAPKRRRGRPKGHPKTGGRKRGTPNKATLALREALRVALADPTGLADVARADPATFWRLFVSMV